MPAPLLQSHVPGYPYRRGKVRDVYDLGDRLVIVATDRISAFDWVLPTGIPDKGRVLTALSLFWFDYLGVPNHLLSTDPKDMGPEFAARADELTGRSVLARKARVVPIECVVRGYLAGSGWKEYRESGTVCGVSLPRGLRQLLTLPQPQRQRDATDGPAGQVFLPARAGQVAAHHALDGDDLRLAHQARPPFQLRGVDGEGRAQGSHVGRDQVVGHGQVVEPEEGQRRQDAALVGDAGGQHPVEGADAVGGDD